VAGKADPPAPARLYTHPDSPFTADQLRKQVISFEKVKLTNNEMDKQGQVNKTFFFFFLFCVIKKKSHLLCGLECHILFFEGRVEKKVVLHPPSVSSRIVFPWKGKQVYIYWDRYVAKRAFQSTLEVPFKGESVREGQQQYRRRRLTKKKMFVKR